MKCFYHDDMDGRCAGFWVYNKYPECEMIPINYNHIFPLNEIEQSEVIYIVDFSIEPEIMKELLKITKNVYWIDHHKTAIEKYKNFPYEIKGIRKDGVAGCVLTFNYLYPYQEMNFMTIYIGDRDIWAWKYGDKTKYFYAGMLLYDTKPESSIWRKALQNPNEIIEKGKIVEQYKEQRFKEIVEAFGFEVEFEGYKCIACNAGKVSSKLFDSKQGYDIMIAFVFNGKEWTVSLYTKDPNIDVSENAKKYGGGGHKGAAGFQCKKLPFKGVFLKCQKHITSF